MSDDVLSEFETLIAAAQADPARVAPWEQRGDGRPVYRPDHDLLVDLLSGPIAAGAATQSGRLAKAFDAWMAHELRRAALDPAEVWPRNTSPRVSSREIAALEPKVEALAKWVAAQDAKADRAARKLETTGDPQAVAAARARLDRAHKRLTRQHKQRMATYDEKHGTARSEGSAVPEPPPAPKLPDRVPVRHELMPGLRSTVQAVLSGMPGVNATNVLGRFYVKQVDVVVSSADRGPDVLISGKTMFSSFAKNTKNRYEETLGEATNLRDRYPLAAMGYAFLVSDTIFAEAGAFGRLQDLLLRTRKPYGPYDATMLLIATSDADSGQLLVRDPATYPDSAVAGQQPPVDLSAGTFFTDLLGALLMNTPVGIHQPVRDLRNGGPVPGGTPGPVLGDADSGTDEVSEANGSDTGVGGPATLFDTAEDADG